MSLKIEQNVPLAQYTTLKVGGVADYFVAVNSEEELVEALRFAKQTSAPPLILGGGSNVLISDIGYRGLVIKNNIRGIKYQEAGDEVILSAGAGEVWDEVVSDCVDKKFWGLENLSAIPGTVGATPVQNVGAYGVEVSSLICEVVAINSVSFERKTFSNQQCQFGYRDSFFKTNEGKGWVITQVSYNLTKQSAPRLSYESLKSITQNSNLIPQVIRAEIIKIRSGKFPNLNEFGTAGSFFKNPIITTEQADKLKQKYPDLPCFESGKGHTKVSLGWILDKVCHLKGYRKNGVCLYEQQALVLVNVSTSSSSDIDNFANEVAQKVFGATGIKIEREVRSV